MSAAAARPRVVPVGDEPLWFLGTLVRPKLDARDTGGRFALWEGTLPRGAAPPLHSHPQDETFYVLEGEVTFWVVEPELAHDPGALLEERGERCGVGAAAFAPGGTAHSFRVETDTARMLFLSTPAGIDEYVRALAEPARWPWLQPPPDGPRVPAERIETVERAFRTIRYGSRPVSSP